MTGRGLSVIWLVACVLIVGASAQTGSAPADRSDDDILLHVHLPREITVRDSFLYLGQVSVVRGTGPAVAQAREIGMGRFSAPGQKVVLDRSTILSRLASLGIPAEKIRLTGAVAVTVRRQQEIIESEDFVEAGRQFVSQYTAAFAVAEIIPLCQPKNLVLGGQPDDVQLKPRFVRGTARGLVTVQIRVMADGKDVGARDVPFRLKYESRQAVTTTDIAEGATLTPENVKIEKRISDQPEPAGWKPPYGLVTTRALRANMDVGAEMIGLAQSSVLVRRNETVVIRLERPGLTVTAVGTALQDARTGETIKVRNDDSRRVIVCKVNPDGTVEPVL
ncbi:MAG: flagellar basal body P-ring formation protein FlgA [Sedimentisphaerales bacterium]|nr:flagellar basal body P-ring formation protein FlgA [Sedimentisphaerales bacterium]